MRAADDARTPFVEDARYNMPPSLTLDQALALWSKWQREALDSLHWVHFDLLASLAKAARGAPSSGRLPSMWDRETPFWDTAGVLSSRLVPGEVAALLRTLVGEFRRFDLRFSRQWDELRADADATQRRALERLQLGTPLEEPETVEWLREARELTTRTGHLALAAHVHRVAALWLLTDYGSSALHVAGPLVVLEALSFWGASLAPSLDCVARVAALAQGLRFKPGSSVFEPPAHEALEEVAATAPAPSSKEAKKPKKKDKDRKKIVQSNSVPGAIGDGAVMPLLPAGPVTRKPTHVLAVWVRPSVEWMAKAQLVGLACVQPAPALSGRHCCVYFDGPKWAHYRHTIKALDESLVAQELREHMQLHWMGAGVAGAVVRLTQPDGSFVDEPVPVRTADEVLRGQGAMDELSATLRKFASSKQAARVLVDSWRTSFSYKGSSDLVITWDSHILMSAVDAAFAPPLAHSGAGLNHWRQSNTSPFLFPYQVVTVTAFDRNIPNKLRKLFKGPLFTPAPGYDDFITAAALLHADLNPRPPWLAELSRAWQEDWQVAFSAKHATAQAPWMRDPSAAREPRQSSSESSSSKGKEPAGGTAHALEEDDDSGIITINDDDSALPRSERTPLLLKPTSSLRRGPATAPRSPLAALWGDLFQRRDEVGSLNSSRRIDDLAIRENARNDPKSFWSNERTLLSWLGVVIFLSISAVQLLTFGDRVPQIAGTVMAPIAMCGALYALVRFHLRNLALLRGGSMTDSGVVDWWGPWVLIPVFCIALLVLVVISFVFGSARVV